MPSAFRRAAAGGGSVQTSPSSSSGSTNKTSIKSSPSLLLSGARGIKAWAGGIHLTSVGLNELDTILGGGQPLGTCILLEEDRWSRDLAFSLVRYWCAEAISHNQHLIIPVPENKDEVDDITSLDFDSNVHENVNNILNYPEKLEMENFLFSLPRNLHWDKLRKQKQVAENSSDIPLALNVLDEVEEDENENEEIAEDEGLENAWQYRKSVQQERLAQPVGTVSNQVETSRTNVFCHSYDLSGRMNDQNEIDLSRYIHPMPNILGRSNGVQAAGFIMFQEWVNILKDTEQDGQVVRFLLFHPRLDTLSIALPLFLSYIRDNLIPVVVMICSPPPTTTDLKTWSLLGRTSDVVLSTEGFSSRKEYPPPPEFRHLQGLMTISKLSTVTAATSNGGGHFGDLTISKRPAAFIYGLKRERRKLHIPLLHIPPEDYAQGGGSVGSGVRSGAGTIPRSTTRNIGGIGCASNL